MEQERRENPLAFLNRLFGGQQQFPDELVRKADSSNNEEAKKKFTYIERYDLKETH